MMSVLNPIIALSAVAGGLGILLVIAYTFLAERGEYTINVNDGSREFTVQGGQTLNEALDDNGISIRVACGGRGICGTCKLRVLEGGGQILPSEEACLDREELIDGYRLSCLIQIQEDMKIEVPEKCLK